MEHSSAMARLLLVNVGLPRDIEWRGRTATSSGRPGFYFRVLEEGKVSADAGPVFVTTARAVWFQERSPTGKSRSTNPLKVIFSSAAHSR